MQNANSENNVLEAPKPTKKRSISSVSKIHEEQATEVCIVKKVKVQSNTATTAATSSNSKNDAIMATKISNTTTNNTAVNQRTLPTHGQKIEVQWDLHKDDGSIDSIWWQATYLNKVEKNVSLDGEEEDTTNDNTEEEDFNNNNNNNNNKNDNMKNDDNSNNNKNKNNNESEGIKNCNLKQNKNELHEILYDAMHGFESEKRLISFIDNHISFDVVEKDYLYWRLLKDPSSPVSDGNSTTIQQNQWNPPFGMSANEYVGNTPGYEKLVIMSANDLVLDQQRLERDHQNGISVEQLGFAAMNTLPHQQQVNGALAYRSFADKVKHKLALLASSNGPNYVVTKHDIEIIMDEIKEEARRVF
jgi:hypothetical protein